MDFRYTSSYRTEDKATLESDLSAVPGRDWMRGLPLAPNRFGMSKIQSWRKALNSGARGRAPEV